MKPNRSSITRVSLTLAAIFTLHPGNRATAASLAWDGSDLVTPGPQGGSGTWDPAVTANWWDGAADIVWPASGTDNDATFGNAAGTVTIDPAGVTANDLSFTTTGYILSGAGTLTLNGSTPTFQLATGVAASIGNNTATVLGGTAGLTKTGAGTLTLNGSAAHGVTGGISVKGGTLALAFANLAPPVNLIDSTNSLSMFNGGTLSTTGKNGPFNTAQTFNGTAIHTGNSTLIVNNASGTSSTVTLGTVSQAEVGGVVSIYSTNPAIANPNTTTQVFKASNPTLNFIGPWAIVGDSKGGSSRWAHVNASNQVVALAATAASANLANVTSATTIYNLNDANSVLAANGSAYAVQDNNVTSRSTTLGGFTLTTNGISHIRGDAAAGTARSFVGATGPGGIVVGAGNELVVAGRNNVTVSVPVLNGIAGNSHLTYAGGGTLRIDTAASTYSGQTTVNSGTVRIGTGGSINSSSGIKVNGGRFVQANTASSVTPALTLQGGTIDGTGTIATVSVSDLAANLVTNGDGTTTALTAGDLTFNGDATIDVRTTGSAGIAVTGTLATTPANGTVTINVPTSNTWVTGNSYPLVSYGSWSGSVSDFAAGTVAGLGGRQTASIGSSGPVAGVLTLDISGDSVVWTGGVNGNWTTGPVGSPFNWQLLAGATGTEFAPADDVIFGNGGPSAVDIPDAAVSPNTVTFTNDSPKNYNFTGAFGIATGTLTKNGTGTVTLATSNTYAGATTVNAGSLVANGGSAIGDGSLVTLANASGAALLVNADETIGALAGGGGSGGNVTIDTGFTLTLSSGTGSFGGILAGDAGLVVSGALQTLGAANTYTAATTISSGGIVAAADQALGTIAGETEVAPGAALGFSGGINYATLEKISGSGAGTAAANAVFSTGSRGFVQSVSGNNTFAGDIDIAANGVSRIGSQNGASLTLTGRIAPASGITTASLLFRPGNNDGDFVILANNTNSWNGSATIFTNAGAGTSAGVRLGVDNGLDPNWSISGAGGTGHGLGTTLDLAGFDQTLNGLFNGNGALTITNSSPTEGSTLTLDLLLERNGTNNVVIVDGASPVSVVKNGNFTQPFTSAHTYTGPTTINAGTLNVSSPLGATDIEVNSGGTLAGTGSLGGSVTVRSGGRLAFALVATPGAQVTRTIAGDLTLDTGNIIDLTAAATPAPGDYVLATITGTVTAATPVVNLPLGVTGSVTVVGNNLQLKVGTPFTNWIGTFGPLADTTTEGDPDFDGLSNLLEFVLNGNPGLSDPGILPDFDASGANFVFSFTRRADSATDTTQVFEYGSTLAAWTPLAITGTPASEVVIGPVVGDTQDVTVTISKGLEVDGKLFGRLKVTQP